MFYKGTWFSREILMVGEWLGWMILENHSIPCFYENTPLFSNLHPCIMVEIFQQIYQMNLIKARIEICSWDHTCLQGILALMICKVLISLAFYFPLNIFKEHLWRAQDSPSLHPSFFFLFFSLITGGRVWRILNGEIKVSLLLKHRSVSFFFF